jgi:hypothetical protein
MKIPRIFCLILFLLAGDIAVPGFLETSSAGAEEVMQLARLKPRRSFLRRVSGRSRLRAQLRGKKNQGFVRKVFSSQRKSRTRRGGRNLASGRFIPRRPVARVFKKVVSPGNGAIRKSRAVVNSIHAQQSKIAKQFSTAARRRID